MQNIFRIGKLSEVISNAQGKAKAALRGDYEVPLISKNGHVLPVLPPYPKGTAAGIQQIDSSQYSVQTTFVEATDEVKFSIFGTPMCFPLEMKLKNDPQFWLLPIEPIITLGGANEIIRRRVAKSSSGASNRRGTIKERWAQDDYSISIDGMISRFDEWGYPRTDVENLRRLVESREPIEVQNELFDIFGITRIVIETYDFPFTKGENNQAFRISAFSDDDWDLLIKLNAR